MIRYTIVKANSKQGWTNGKKGLQMAMLQTKANSAGCKGGQWSFPKKGIIYYGKSMKDNDN